MRNLANIEPSGFHHGEYVGYAAGVWRITRRNPSGWHCAKRDAADYLTARTLRELSEQLTQHTKGRQS